MAAAAEVTALTNKGACGLRSQLDLSLFVLWNISSYVQFFDNDAVFYVLTAEHQCRRHPFLESDFARSEFKPFCDNLNT